MATLPDVLSAIARQHTDRLRVELVAIDTASSDGTADFLRQRATRLIEIPAGSFNHGRTRNDAIAAARGELVVILSQDAEPADDEWLMRLTTPLVERPRVAGTYARQQPRPDAGAIARHYHAGWIGSSAEPRLSRIESREAFEQLSPLDQMRLCTFDNVCSCIRRDVWKVHPFPTTPIAEDIEWCRDVLLAGFDVGTYPRRSCCTRTTGLRGTSFSGPASPPAAAHALRYSNHSDPSGPCPSRRLHNESASEAAA